MRAKIGSRFLAVVLALAILGTWGCGGLQNIDIQDNVEPKIIKEQNVTANLYIGLWDEYGRLKDYREYHNLVVNAGLVAIPKQMLGDTGGGAQPAKFNYIAIGTNATAEAAGNTALGAEIGTRVQDTNPTFPATGQGKLSVQFLAGNGTGAITESGVLNASTAGTLLARKTFAVINKGASDVLQINWTFTLTATP